MNKPLLYVGYIESISSAVLVAAFTADEALARMKELCPGKDITLSGAPISDNIFYYRSR